MLYKGLLGVELSGALGGVVASHNKGGSYFRERVIPTNPNSTFQQAVRNAVSSLSSFWQDSLTQTQRDGWDVYASNVTVPNRLGDQVNISGLAHFVRSNVTRLQTASGQVDDAPAVFNLGAYTPPTVASFSEATQLGAIGFSVGTLSDAWANEANGWMIMFVSPPQNSGVKYYRGPYRVAFAVQGDPTPPVSPLPVTPPFAITSGQRLFTRAVTMRADGRYSASSFQTTLVGA